MQIENDHLCTIIEPADIVRSEILMEQPTWLGFHLGEQTTRSTQKRWQLVVAYTRCPQAGLDLRVGGEGRQSRDPHTATDLSDLVKLAQVRLRSRA